eukprot:scaffold11287_cov20-Tisochrysis_lutea.AAC.3
MAATEAAAPGLPTARGFHAAAEFPATVAGATTCPLHLPENPRECQHIAPTPPPLPLSRTSTACCSAYRHTLLLTDTTEQPGRRP